MRLALSLVLAASLAGAARPAPRAVARGAYLMGTFATLATYDRDRSNGLQRLERLLEALERSEAQLSTWRADSDVSRLNARAGGGRSALPPALCELFVALDEAVGATGGAFDPAIGALTAAWDIHGTGRIPPLPQLDAARSRSGWRRVAFDPSTCTIAPPAGLSFDVGGFGKGEALDRAREAAAGEGAPWLIDLGGQVAAAGAPPDCAGWDVSIAHPLRRRQPALRVTLSSGSLATSAGSERDLTVAGRRIGHILDPGTGRPAPFTSSVTVWDERALLADALSTALYVMGPDAGLRWADARGVAACYLLPRGATALPRPSRAFRERFGLR